MIENLKIFESPLLIAEYFVSEFISVLEEFEKSNRKLYLALSGGKTPEIIFKQLASASLIKKINWNILHLLWVDERCVSPHHSESNYGNAKKLLIDKIQIPASNIHRIRGEEKLDGEVKRYSEELVSMLPLNNRTTPIIDWTLLGIGEDGHTASIFPEQILSSVQNDIAGVAHHPKTNQNRITLALNMINNSQRITFIVTGKEKAKVLSEISRETQLSRRYPVNEVKPVNGRIEWWVDKESSSLLR